MVMFLGFDECENININSIVSKIQAPLNFRKKDGIIDTDFPLDIFPPNFQSYSMYYNYINNSVFHYIYKRYSYILLCIENINQIIKLIKLCEPFEEIYDLGCGSGWLSFYLKNAGFGVIPIDQEYHDERYYAEIKIIRKNFLDLKYNSKNIYILCWPKFGEDPVKLWNAMPENTYFIYIGEYCYGINASVEFCKIIKNNIIAITDLYNFNNIFGLGFLCRK